MYHERDWDAHKINTPQPRRIEKLLADHGFSSARPLAAQLEHKVMLMSASKKSKHDDPYLSSYASIVGGLTHIANSTKPGISFVASMLARYMACQADEYLVQVQHNRRYLAGSRDYKLVAGRRIDSGAMAVGMGVSRRFAILYAVET
jgi:hypothetical protein